MPLPDDHYPICGSCLIKAPQYQQAYASLLYCEPLKSLLQRYKYQQQLPLAQCFIELMLAKPAPFLTEDCILIPVPQHRKKLRQRGFNPVAEIAKGLARQLERPLLLRQATKQWETPAQASLGSRERRRNLRGCFRCAPIAGGRLVIIDDLLTSGSTVAEFGRCLYQAGAQEVRVWSLARAV
ncbi:MAG: ComF family protein [Legionellaceae bacterium]|nr:ComF family protein [Legionellaceae bacterium]